MVVDALEGWEGRGAGEGTKGVRMLGLNGGEIRGRGLFEACVGGVFNVLGESWGVKVFWGRGCESERVLD